MDPVGNPLYHPEVLGACGVLVSMCLSWAIIQLAKYVRQKSKIAWSDDVILKLGDASVKAVRAVYQEYVAAIKDGKDPASEGGTRLTPAEKAMAKARAVAKVKSMVSLTELIKLFGSQGLASSAISNNIEAAVNLVKKSSKVPVVTMLAPLSPQD